MKYVVFGFIALIALVFLLIIIGVIAENKGTTPSSTLSEPDYKASTMNTTVAALDKDSNADKGKHVHFTATILNCVKDSNGNMAGANVENGFTSGVIQVAFPSGTDLIKLNTGDTIEVWDVEGSFSGKNAFGATIQEVGIGACLYERSDNRLSNSIVIYRFGRPPGFRPGWLFYGCHYCTFIIRQHYQKYAPINFTGPE